MPREVEKGGRRCTDIPMYSARERLGRLLNPTLSGLERDVGALLQDYGKICLEELADLSPMERREVYGMLGLTVEAHPAGKLEATWLLNASPSKVRSRSPRLCGLCP